jgi:Uma2 family endonuclease
MSSPREPGAAPAQDDPFPYGWREVPRRPVGGRLDYEMVPLTLEDALHPQEGDVMPQNTPHDRDVGYFSDVLRHQCADDPTALILCDVIVVWDVPGLRQHSPDVAVVFGVTAPEAARSTFDVAAEGARPALIIEVVSPATRRNDVVTKVRHYSRAAVPLYVIVDRERIEGPPRLVGYRRGRRGWVRLRPDARGRLWLPPVRLWLGARDNRVVCQDEEGHELGDYEQTRRDLEELERRNAAVEAEVERLVEARREAQAEARREAEARAAAEARLRELEEQIRRLQQPPSP